MKLVINSHSINQLLIMMTYNLEEGKPIQQVPLEIEATTEDSIKYIIKISNADNK